MSAITHQTDLIAYKRKLPKSAIGYVIVSHTDKDGVNRLQNYGIDFFDLDAASDYDELVRNPNATSEEKAALVPWTANTFYSVPKGTIIKSSDGTQFIVTETVESRSLKEPFSVIKNDPVKYADFIEAGGWNGIKYLKIPVIQGVQMSKELGQAMGTRFESFTIDALDIENASNIISCEFFNITVTPYIKNTSGEDVEDGISQKWEKVENIGLAGPYDKVFEIKILSDEQKVLIKFGDGITGQMLPKDAKITINYLKTKGEAGNVSNRFQMTDITFPPGMVMVDPRTNQVSKFICCTNVSPVMGGHNIEDENDIKENAPVSYLDFYTIGSKKTYMSQIKNNSPVNLLHVNIYKANTLSAGSYGTITSSDEYASSLSPEGVLQELVTNKKALLISALRANGEKIDDPENEVLVPLRQALDDYMSPGDSLEFIHPNVVKLCPRITVSTTSSILETDIQEQLKPKIYSKYSIFSRSYGDKLYKSTLVDLVHNESYTDSVACFLEAKTEASLKPTILTTMKQEYTDWLNNLGNTVNKMSEFQSADNIRYESLFAFSFSFDKIFAQDTVHLGFKNFKQESPYLIKVNIEFTDSNEDSRTLFLYDDRKCLNEDIAINDAYFLAYNDAQTIPAFKKTTYGNSDLNWADDFSDRYVNLQARTAQFPLQHAITSKNFMVDAKNFNANPFEIRPLYIDEEGKNVLFNVDEVSADDQVSLNFDNDVTTNVCYRKNWQFWDHTRIEFNENYDKPNSDYYANGRIIIPARKVLSSTDITTLKVVLENVKDFDKQAEEIERMLKEKMKITVYAMPVQEEFECINDNDIICVDKDDIMVEKKFIKE